MKSSIHHCGEGAAPALPGIFKASVPAAVGGTPRAFFNRVSRLTINIHEFPVHREDTGFLVEYLTQQMVNSFRYYFGREAEMLKNLRIWARCAE